MKFEFEIADNYFLGNFSKSIETSPKSEGTRQKFMTL